MALYYESPLTQDLYDDKRKEDKREREDKKESKRPTSLLADVAKERDIAVNTDDDLDLFVDNDRNDMAAGYVNSATNLAQSSYVDITPSAPGGLGHTYQEDIEGIQTQLDIKYNDEFPDRYNPNDLANLRLAGAAADMGADSPTILSYNDSIETTLRGMEEAEIADRMGEDLKNDAAAYAGIDTDVATDLSYDDLLDLGATRNSEIDDELLIKNLELALNPQEGIDDLNQNDEELFEDTREEDKEQEKNEALPTYETINAKYDYYR